MLDWEAVMAIDNAWLEDQFGSRLSYVNMTAISHFLDQVEQVQLEFLQTRIGLFTPDILDDDLSS